MAPLTIIPYSYAPTKPRNYSHISSGMHTQPGARASEQHVEPGVLPMESLQQPIAGIPGKRREDSCLELPPGNRTPDSTVSTASGRDGSHNGRHTGHEAVAGETALIQVDLAENCIIDIDRFIKEQNGSPIIEDVESHLIDQQVEAPANQACNSASEDSAIGPRQLLKRRSGNQNELSIFSDGSFERISSSDESDSKSIFEDRRSKRSKSDSSDSSPDPSLYCRELDKGAPENLTLLYTDHQPNDIDLDGRQNGGILVETDSSRNEVYQSDSDELDSDASGDELCRSPLWVAQVTEADQEWEICDIIGREDIDGVVHYMVQWNPTLMPKHSLGKATGLINKFEARLRSQARQKSGRGRPTQLKGDQRETPEAQTTEGTQQKKRRGRPRKRE